MQSSHRVAILYTYTIWRKSFHFLTKSTVFSTLNAIRHSVHKLYEAQMFRSYQRPKKDLQSLHFLCRMLSHSHSSHRVTMFHILTHNIKKGSLQRLEFVRRHAIHNIECVGTRLAQEIGSAVMFVITANAHPCASVRLTFLTFFIHRRQATVAIFAYIRHLLYLLYLEKTVSIF